MTRANPDPLTVLAGILEPMLEELVFVGGAVTGILVTDTGAGEPRPTLDVDSIAEITSYAEYAAFGERLRALGFSEDTREGAPVCRWMHSGMILDVMPVDEGILGFSNRWYRNAMDSASRHQLPNGLIARVVSAPYFVATKLEAFHGRGQSDITLSHDLEDLIFVIDGRTTIVEEVRREGVALREYLRAEFRALLDTTAFLDSLPGYLLPDTASQARLVLILQRMHALAEKSPA